MARNQTLTRQGDAPGLVLVLVLALALVLGKGQRMTRRVVESYELLFRSDGQKHA